MPLHPLVYRVDLLTNNVVQKEKIKSVKYRMGHILVVPEFLVPECTLLFYVLNVACFIWYLYRSETETPRANKLLLMIRIVIPPSNEVGGGGVYWIHLVRLSVCASVCRRHGFRSISQVCFEISIWNFICIFMVVISRGLSIFSDVTFKMAAWRPYWIFWFPDSNFSLALNIYSKLQRHNTYVYR